MRKGKGNSDILEFPLFLKERALHPEYKRQREKGIGKMKSVRKVIHLIGKNWKTMACFELLYKLLSLAIFTPLFWSMFNGIMKLTGYRYLTLENILSFLGNPVTIGALLVLFVCMAVYTMVDISAVIFLLDASWQERRVTFRETAVFALKNAGKVFWKGNRAIAFVVLFLIPFLNLGVASSYVSSISVPEFVMDFIVSNTGLLFLFLAVMVLLGALLLRWLYAFHYFTLEGCDFKEARKRSRNLGKGKRLRDLGVLLGVQFFCYLSYFILLAAGVVLALELGSLFEKLKWMGIVSASVVWVVLAVSLLVMSALGTPVSYGCISLLFYERKKARREEIRHCTLLPLLERKGRRWLRYGLGAGFLALCVLCCSFYLYAVYNHKVDIRVEYLRTMEVTAHRGASRFFPENTMAAFAGAGKLGADWIELDVQQGRDGQIFVMHDTNCLRTTGVDQNTWELTMEQQKQLDAGSFFDEAFANEPVPLLTEVIAFAKKANIKLNIELKPTGHEHEFEKCVADILIQENFLEHCVVTSQVYEVLENIKAYNEKVQTAYVMSLAYGDISPFTAADHFSIEATSVTEKLVSDVHNAGKKLYAWNVNTPENIERMIALNVDNSITDDVTLAKELIFRSKTSDVVTEYVNLMDALTKGQ